MIWINFCPQPFRDELFPLIKKVSSMSLGLLTIHIQIPGCMSLKEKRSRLKPLMARLQREFNISVAELDYQDSWQDALIGCSFLSNDHNHTQRSLQKIILWIEKNRRDVYIVEDHIEII